MKFNAPKVSHPRNSGTFSPRLIFIAVAAFALLTVAASSAFMAGISGAIFTTDGSCSGTNVNIFASKDDVYLDGGPHHTGAAGLPDGTYYAQVTEPNGTLLGRSPSANVLVASGEFAVCYQLSAILNTASSGLTVAGYDDTSNGGGVYKVWISADPNFAESASKTDSFKVDACDPNDPNCNPSDQSTLRVRKYYDANANGINDDSQPIEGWKVHIEDNINLDRFTAVDLIVDPDTYTVTELPTLELNWLHTGCTVADNLAVTSAACVPGPDTTSVGLLANDDKTVEFGNVCLGTGGGLTLGFWSNKNGQGLVNQPDVDYLNGLYLRDSAGNNLQWAGSLSIQKTALKNFLLGANATNMANMLSAQLTAMELNVRHNNVSGGALVYAPCLIGSEANETALGFITISDLMAAAEAELQAHGIATAAGAIRDYQECLKTTLDRANNNKNFVQAAPCPFTFAD
jgi:hypothetical protein